MVSVKVDRRIDITHDVSHLNRSHELPPRLLVFKISSGCIGRATQRRSGYAIPPTSGYFEDSEKRVPNSHQSSGVRDRMQGGRELGTQVEGDSEPNRGGHPSESA